jgi:hypothetical protein
MFMAAQALTISKIFDTFTAPLAPVNLIRNGSRRISYVEYKQNAFALFGVYTFVSFILAFTGGSLGMSLLQWSPRATTNLMWGFSAGVLIVALARISAVYLSVSLASYLQLLVIFTIGICTYEFFQDYTFLTKFVDNIIRPAAGPYFVVFAVVTIGLSIALTEGIIVGLTRFRRANLVPYSMLTNRIQEHTKVQQVFSPTAVVPFTNEVIRRVISEEGLVQVHWVTTTPPISHLETMIDALTKHPDYAGKDAFRILRDATKVILCSMDDSARDDIYRFLERRNVAVVKAPTRVRYLVINRHTAIVHLPIPYTGQPGEQSNCAHVIEADAQVSLWNEKFLAWWSLLKDPQSNSTGPNIRGVI